MIQGVKEGHEYATAGKSKQRATLAESEAIHHFTISSEAVVQLGSAASVNNTSVFLSIGQGKAASIGGHRDRTPAISVSLLPIFGALENDRCGAHLLITNDSIFRHLVRKRHLRPTPTSPPSLPQERADRYLKGSDSLYADHTLQNRIADQLFD